MPANPENPYEDYYQKRERLIKELDVIFDETKQFSELLKKDFGAADEIGEKLRSIDVKMATLRSDEIILWAELRNIKNKTEIEAGKSEKIDDLHKKILLNSEEQSKLFNEMDEALTEEVGQRGDSEGTLAIIKMKMSRFEEIQRELAELEEE